MLNINSESKLIIMQKDNIYHQTLIEEFVGFGNIKIIDVPLEDKYLKKYKRNVLMMDKEILRIELPEGLIKIPKTLFELNLKHRSVVFVASSTKNLTELRNIEIGEHKPIVLANIESWKSKVDFYIGLIVNLGYVDYFESEAILDLVVRLLVKKPESFKEVKLILNLAEEKNSKINKEYLEIYFPDVDFHNFTDFMLSSLEGNLKVANIKLANYFLDVRKYSPDWTVKKFRDTVLELSLVYRAYRLGVIHLQPENRDIITERAEIVKWSGGKKLSNIPKGLMYKYFNFIKDVPYQQFVEIETLIFSKDTNEKTKSKLEVYTLLEELRVIDMKYPPKVFKNKKGWKK